MIPRNCFKKVVARDANTSRTAGSTLYVLTCLNSLRTLGNVLLVDKKVQLAPQLFAQPMRIALAARIWEKPWKQGK